ncbi:MAG: hypothetical protein HQ568_12060, partial [Calditrichaeota bacterium]|nr:hypothetical protein [Calditrichota bacterium]
TQPYTTTFILRIPDVGVNQAYQMAEDFINCIADYARRDGVGDWLNDSLTFHVRLDSDADINLKWTTSADRMRAFVNEKINMEGLIESCEKVENW